ncbi:DUF4136 domain-containing protein [Noviherbaspirillum suwonense]|jgi:hypothetical protein|uniref:DUF4136 domain-containing protein n=1 Tax=Noviherbaspirillum suwonense TaxID=1224511 RepID=A0ABY1PSD7_9BURK|nr:DUF4136 domain-containing protein [Noviherbaspirillum suwonense]SMP41800.1 protein of unknown function [Noviherbaspirillum suwonense]
MMSNRSRLPLWLALLFALLLSGCAGTIVRSEVTAFHDAAIDFGDKTYAFSRDARQDNDLEYRSYENLVRGELQRLGFAETAGARLQVAMRYQVDARDMRVIEPVVVDPWYGPGFGRYRYPYGFYGPYADPFWFGPPLVQPVERRFVSYSRRLEISIARAADRKNLVQVIVNSQGQNPSLAAVMPAMVRSAFADFPGPSGVPRVLELKLEPAR